MDTEKKDVKSPKKKTVVGEVNCSQLYMREAPSKDSDVLRILTNKEPVIIEEGGTEDFYKVINNGLVGYCAKEYITIV